MWRLLPGPPSTATHLSTRADALGPFSSGDLMDGFSPRGGGPMLPIPQHVAVHAGAGGTPGHASCYLPLLTADPLHPPGQLDFAQGGAGYALPLHRMGAHHALRYGAQGDGSGSQGRRGSQGRS